MFPSNAANLNAARNLAAASAGVTASCTSFRRFSSSTASFALIAARRLEPSSKGGV
jgi:hypothetical protein